MQFGYFAGLMDYTGTGVRSVVLRIGDIERKQGHQLGTF